MSAPPSTPKPAIVLVHGSWHGAWCWRRVLPLLRGAGVETHAVTLTGVGERAHLLSPAVGIETHVQDVVGLIEAEELAQVVLVGHSYAGNLITCVADRLQRSRPGLLRHLVYLDASVPHPGNSWSTPHTPETVAKRVAEAQDSGGLSFPPPDASVFCLSGADRDWVNRRQTPQPFRLYQETLHFDPDLVWSIPHSFIDCTDPPLATIDAARRRVRSEPGWGVYEMATGHDPMVSAPEALSKLLLDIHARAR
ncbi:MAG: alpha/beta hydrolase [Hydrogenophaga sp.]|uniref:alpha/beta fold hydrolase n=1 Tax=Hydrogenophaga sp. TaxID=1904254 RepID=UPI00272F82EF|nr:alpha/beta hydrolase [Hydrogenophaga sp.]MDP2164294.1 alpha/beta hydrolase [Hydrogenophaga sp.]